MKIDRAAFEQAFIQRAGRVLAEKPAPSPGPVDGYAPSPPAELPPGTPFRQAVLGLSAAAAAGGVPLLAAVAQDVGRSLVTPEQEDRLGRSRLDGFERYVVSPEAQPRKLERVAEAWARVARAVDSPFPAPKVIDLTFTFAEADAREMFLGSRALEAELADDSVLAFTLAHEEGHRRHRDTAGSAGLDALVEASEELPKDLARQAFLALGRGRHDNETRADLFAAETCARLGSDPAPILAFLMDSPGDMQHPDGFDRARAVRDRMAALGRPLPEGEWSRLEAEARARRPAG